MGLGSMVVAVKRALMGQKVAGVPNFQPLFWASQNYGMGQGYASAVQLQPGRYHTWVYSACQAIIQPFVDLPAVMYSLKNEEKLVEEHPILDLIKAPNPEMGGTNFFEAILWNLLLPTTRTPGGQAFIIGERPTNFRKGEVPKELWVFGDECMTPRVDGNGVLIGWTFGFGTAQMPLELDQVIRIHLFNKYNLKQGLCPLAAAMIEVDQDAKAKEFNTRFMENGAVPGGMVSLDGSPPDKPIWESIQTMFKEKYSGFQNAGKTLFMPWMLKYEQFARSHLDMAYMEQLGWNRDSILAAYRVNKWAVGVSEDLNYATAKEATRQLIERCVLPLSRVVFTALNEGWIRYLDKRNLRMKLDLSEAQALKEDRSVKIKDAGELIEQGLPPAAAYEFVGLDIDTAPYPWLQEDRSLAGQFAQRQEEEEEAEEGKKPEKPEKDIRITKDERDALAKSYVEKVFAPGERIILPIITRFFTAQRNQMQDHAREILRGAPTLSGINPKAFLIDQKGEDVTLIRSFQGALLEQVKRVIRQIRQEMPQKSLNLDSTEDDIRAFLRQRLLGLSEINATTFRGVEERLADILADGQAQNLTVDQMAKAIQDGLFEVYQGRLKTTGTIARTETATVTSAVRHEVFTSAGIQRLEWLTARDQRVRETHMEEDGHIVRLGEAFPVTHLHYPCEPGGPAEEVINCRCVALAVEEE